MAAGTSKFDSKSLSLLLLAFVTAELRLSVAPLQLDLLFANLP